MAEELLKNASYGEYIVRRSESQAEQLRIVLYVIYMKHALKMALMFLISKFYNPNTKKYFYKIAYSNTTF